MKKALITLLVLVLVGALLFGLYYFLWTPGNLAALGSRAMEKGKYSRAIFYYTHASEMDPGNPEYVLSLADACIADDRNYTQAERSLVNAIKAAPSAALYMKLSSVYIAQDKLMDAQKMSDSITDASVQAELAAMRPAAPVLSPEPGEYDEYVSLTLESGEGRVCYSLTDEYPSLSNVCEAPVELSAGQTHVQALVVGNNGLVSPLVEGDYLIVGVVEDVTFVSPELEAYVRETLYIPRTETVTTENLWEITELTVPTEVTDYSDLRYFTNLQTLIINDSAAEDYSFLQYTTALTELDLSGCILSADTLELIGGLENLKVLKLAGCGLSNIQSLGGITAPEVLDLSNNSISDITVLSGFKTLTDLNLENNAVTVLTALDGMRSLTSLNLRGNNVSDLSPLTDSYNLTSLRMDNNALSGVSVLAEMKQLQEFTASHNNISDISAMAVCNQLTRLELANNQLTNVDVIASMPNLAYLDISHNQVAALPKLDVTFHLQQIYASYNQLESVASLIGLPELTYVDVDYNEKIEDIACLSPCYLLVQVNAFGTKVKEVKVLTDMGVIVNYDPTNAEE